MKTQFTNHAMLMIRMYKNEISEKFAKDYSINEILKCCNRIEKRKNGSYGVRENEIFQETLIKDENFIDYLNYAYENSFDMERFKLLLDKILENNEKMSDYNIEDIKDVINNEILSLDSIYDYLKYFRNENEYFKIVITNNLNHFNSQSEININRLTDSQRNLFKLNFLNNCNLIPLANIDKIYEKLDKNKELREFIDFLYKYKLFLPLDFNSYCNIENNNPKEIKTLLEKIVYKISDNEISYNMLLKWISNGCKIYDLEIINNKVDVLNKNNLKKIFSSRTEYINFIYGSKLKKFPMDMLNSVRENLIIYAISKNKKSFLKLIEENSEAFFAIPYNSILYSEEFYKKYVNLNAITIKHLNKLNSMIFYNYSNINKLKEGHYTFEEISTLYNESEAYILLYNELLDLKIDDRLLRIKQFIKKNLLEKDYSVCEIQGLAKKIKEKPLYMWLEQDFSNIKNLNITDVVDILVNYDKIKKYICDIKSRNEVAFIIRNVEILDNYDTLTDLKNDIENIDIYWTELKELMEFDNEFVKKYKNNIYEFLFNNGSELAYKYYNDIKLYEKKSFKLIVKSVLMGKFKDLKYHTNDLISEIDFKLNEYQINEWTNNNIKIQDEVFEVSEYDDFYHTMILGKYPDRTCLCYDGGMYNKCLLACFDSNKKILYAKINGKIVARAMIRLTKGNYNSTIEQKRTIEFYDVENDAGKEIIESNIVNSKETLTLFLEKPYISGISKEEEIEVKKLFIKLLRQKAEKMNALLVLNKSYDEAVNEEFILSKYYMYISKSKSSAQYLDSLSGQATISDEGQYKSNTFLILKNE
ncbi:MAG: hypothetical protein J6M60_00320 [Clostridia bacterium]|nr:hypothetical protein [Clostridia bacterium]